MKEENSSKKWPLEKNGKTPEKSPLKGNLG